MLVTVLGIVGGVVSDVQPSRKLQPMLLTVLGIVGGVVSDVQLRRKPFPMLVPVYLPNTNSNTFSLPIDIVFSFLTHADEYTLNVFLPSPTHTLSMSSFVFPNP
jgi:hypothetical protein